MNSLQLMLNLGNYLNWYVIFSFIREKPSVVKNHFYLFILNLEGGKKVRFRIVAFPCQPSYTDVLFLTFMNCIDAWPKKILAPLFCETLLQEKFYGGSCLKVALKINMCINLFSTKMTFILNKKYFFFCLKRI